jgi:hypothetical protein
VRIDTGRPGYNPARMSLALEIAATLALEAFAGAALVTAIAHLAWRRTSTRRRRASWMDGARSLRWLPLLAVVALVAVAGLRVAALRGAAPGTFDPWPSSIAFLVAGAPAAAGGWLLVHAGLRERGGRVRKARREVRLGGVLVAAGAFAQLFVVWGDLLFRRAFCRAIVVDTHGAGLALVGGMLLAGVASFVAILAALTGKPRPGGRWAALLYAAAVIGFVLGDEWARSTPLPPRPAEVRPVSSASPP